MNQIQILVPYFLPDKALNLYNSPYIYFGLFLSTPLLPDTKFLENLTSEASTVYSPTMPFTKQVLKSIHWLNCWQGEWGKEDTGEPQEARSLGTHFTYLTAEGLKEATICVIHTPIQCHLWVLPSAWNAWHVAWRCLSWRADQTIYVFVGPQCV